MNIKFVPASIVYKGYSDKFDISTGTAENVFISVFMMKMVMMPLIVLN
ncbi:MAG: hypothetical protein L6U99_09030 [Clostridium sp.]|nr:MAG: hypothetical protein L6U99_09030 [Clostridium sp.]